MLTNENDANVIEANGQNMNLQNLSINHPTTGGKDEIIQTLQDSSRRISEIVSTTVFIGLAKNSKKRKNMIQSK
eukprot:8153982-Ditylum_brightwellii.AAC.1